MRLRCQFLFKHSSVARVTLSCPGRLAHSSRTISPGRAETTSGINSYRSHEPSPTSLATDHPHPRTRATGLLHCRNSRRHPLFRRERAKRLPEFTPPVSLLKPVHDIDFASYENFSSFCKQEYPDYEILFCVNDLSDHAVPLIERLIKEYPQRKIRVLSGAEQIGSNRKVNNLALLTHEAQHEILIQSDADVRVDPRYIREMVAPFANPSVGAVSCFYRGIAEKNLGAELEAVGAASDFSAGALIADWKEGVTFALGASVVTTKSWLGKIGGYEALANLLADDYEIGNRIHKAGGKVLLSRELVWTMYPAQTAQGILAASSSLGQNDPSLPSRLFSWLAVYTRLAMDTSCGGSLA